jgi:excisionase family DNA binding protein
MKVTYSMVKGRLSAHCISWVYRKKRHRRYFKSRLDALRFQNEKEIELGIPQRAAIGNEILFWLLSEINDKLRKMEQQIETLKNDVAQQEGHLKELKKPPAPKILRISEAAKVLRVSSRKLYYLLEKGVFKRYKLPHTRTTFIKLDEVEKALGAENIEDLLR